MGIVALQRLAELFKQLALTLVQVDRRFHRYPAHQVASRATAHWGHALAAQAEQLAGLGALGNLQLDPTIEGRHFQLATQRRIGEADRHLAVQVLAVTLEDRMLTDVDHHIQVASRATMRAGLTLARQANAITGIDTWRHLDRQCLALFHTTLPMATATGVGDHLAAAVATRASLLHREEALLHAYLTDTTTGGTGDRAGALLGAGTIAGLATNQRRHADGYAGAAHRFFQIQLEGVAQVTAALGAATRTAASTTEEVAEHVTEDIGEVGAAETSATAAAHLRVDPGVAVLVVGRTFGRVRKHFVGLVGLLEFLFGVFVIRVAVRVIFHRQTPVGLLQLGFTSTALDPQDLVIVTFCHSCAALSDS